MKQVFKLVDSTFSVQSFPTLPTHDSLEHLVESFGDFFESKIIDIRRSLSQQPSSRPKCVTNVLHLFPSVWIALSDLRTTGARGISLPTRRRAVSVLWCFLYADCILVNKPLVVNYPSIWKATVLSNAPERNDRLEMGEYLAKTSASRLSFFIRGKISDFLKKKGKMHWS